MNKELLEAAMIRYPKTISRICKIFPVGRKLRFFSDNYQVIFNICSHCNEDKEDGEILDYCYYSLGGGFYNSDYAKIKTEDDLNKAIEVIEKSNMFMVESCMYNSFSDRLIVLHDEMSNNMIEEYIKMDTKQYEIANEYQLKRYLEMKKKIEELEKKELKIRNVLRQKKTIDNISELITEVADRIKEK